MFQRLSTQFFTECLTHLNYYDIREFDGEPLIQTRLKHLAAQSRHNSMILFKAVGSIADL